MYKIIIILSSLAIMMSCGGKDSTPQTNHSVPDSIMNLQGYEALDLLITPTGHITVAIPVNSKPCLFMIDTGAGATVIDRSKQDRFGLKTTRTADYAAGIGSFSRLTATTAVMNIHGHEIQADSLYLMDISFVNAELKKHHSRKVDGLLGADFLKKHHAVIDYHGKKLYVKVEPPKDIADHR